MRTHILLTAALAATATVSFAADTNVLLGKTVTSVNGTVVNNLSTVTDGQYLPKGEAWYNAVCWNDPNTSLLIDLGGQYSLTKMNGQFDDNEAYRVDYLGTDNVWRTAWNVSNADIVDGIDLHGMQSRPDVNSNDAWYTLPYPIIATQLRVSPVGGDYAYAVSEVRAVGQPVPEPGTWAALGLGAVGFLKRRKRS